MEIFKDGDTFFPNLVLVINIEALFWNFCDLSSWILDIPKRRELQRSNLFVKRDLISNFVLSVFRRSQILLIYVRWNSVPCLLCVWASQIYHVGCPGTAVTASRPISSSLSQWLLLSLHILWKNKSTQTSH